MAKTRKRSLRSQAPIALIHAIPLVVLALDWNPTALLVGFSLELHLCFLFGLIKVSISLPGSRETPGTEVTYSKGAQSMSTRVSAKKFIIPIYLMMWAFLSSFVNGAAMYAFGAFTSREEVGRLLANTREILGVVALLTAEQAWEFCRDFVRGPSWVRRDPTFHAVPPVDRVVFGLVMYPLGAVFTTLLNAPHATLAAFLVVRAFLEMRVFTSAPGDVWERNPPLESPPPLLRDAT